MQIAKEADAAAVGTYGCKHTRRFRLGHALGLYRLSVFIHRLEPLAVQQYIVGILAAEHGVGLGAGGNQDGLGRQPHRLAGGAHLACRWIERMPRDMQRRGMTEAVHFHRFRRQAFSESDALFKRFPNLFVIQRVAR
jgi:hypothetical protein